MAGYDWQGFRELQTRLSRCVHLDATPLIEQWEAIIVEGNRRGVLSGRDGNDQPMPALKYRNGKGKRTGNRKVPDFGTSKHGSTGFGPYAVGLHDNLTTGQYMNLTGPRLAPRGERSRSIKNLETETRHDPAKNRWEAVGAWRQVVSVKGVYFLPFHFDPAPGSRLPRYDLRPVRPKDFQFCANALRAFVRQLLRAS